MIDTIRAWTWIKAQGEPISNFRMRAHFRCSTDSAAHILCRLKRLGAIELHGKTHHAKWHILDPSVVVESRRGDHPKSIDNLKVQWVKTTGNSHARVAKRKDWGGLTDLERCWKLPSVSNIDKQDCDTLDTRVPEVRPEFLDAA